jgi:cysteinyl-tRNA synthetase
MMTLRLYNTLTREKEPKPFEPIDRNNVRMYVCGPTVYDFAHIGNARPVIVFDVLFRLLRYLYGADKVTYIRNITDVDDKINDRALKDFGKEIGDGQMTLNEAIRRVTEKTANQFEADVKALGCLEPTAQPRATEFIAEMMVMISTLIAKGHAYEAGGEVLFNVASMKDYGALSNRKLEDQQAGARVAVEAHKKNPGDFVLWKLSSAEEPGWESPWGRGRPGWHIECSAMSDSLLWEKLRREGSLSDAGLARPHEFDIHGGGLDLIFPHHENEIAQSRCAHGTSTMAKVWMHNGFLQVEGQKMSKSLGNFVTISELLSGWNGIAWPGSVIRLSMLMTHYRQPIDFTQRALEESSIALSYFATFGFVDDEVAPSKEFMAALDDDLNTPRAIAELHRLLNVARHQSNAIAVRAEGGSGLISDTDYLEASQLAAGLKMLGIHIDNFNTRWLRDQQTRNLDTTEAVTVNSLITARLAARAAKNWKESDRIRDELAAMGVSIKDNKDGTTSWEVKR